MLQEGSPEVVTIVFHFSLGTKARTHAGGMAGGGGGDDGGRKQCMTQW